MTHLLGAHVPTAGGVARAPDNGQSIAATAIQIFTRNQRQWLARPISPEEADAFRAALGASAIRSVLSHASYLINLSSVVPDFLRKSRECLVEEIRRCHVLGIPDVVLHPGAHMGMGEEAGLAAAARSLDHALESTRGTAVRLLLEVTAGQGSCLAYRFEHLRAILDQVTEPERVGVCLDTCHLFAAGYDLASAKGYERTLEAFDRQVGLARLKAIHLNDSKTPLGSRVDRHARVGEGFLGLGAFRRLLNDERLRHVPMVLETPGPLPEWKKEIALLRGLIRRPARERRRRVRASPRARVPPSTRPTP